MIILVGVPWALYLGYYLFWMVKRKPMATHKRYDFQGNRYYFIIDRWTQDVVKYESVNDFNASVE